MKIIQRAQNQLSGSEECAESVAHYLLAILGLNAEQIKKHNWRGGASTSEVISALSAFGHCSLVTVNHHRTSGSKKLLERKNLRASSWIRTRDLSVEIQYANY
ncbi:uncharacterized protein [Rhodnius prolixus]|uniref:uncharacterized protein n=1 Tax=Rhodnius prolixus TaxID=13249 RepID=UPI003D18807C